jgi:tRNA threonylcarbamoyladenosine dehydratase
MEKNWKERTELIIGQEGSSILQNSHVLIVGLGGVGSYAAEAIARAGVGTLTIVDGDVVDPTNRNRQLQALSSTHGQGKALLMEQRLRDINPEINLNVIHNFLGPEEMLQVCSQNFDYVVDAIDSITPKLQLLQTAYAKGLKIVSSMGAGGKMDPTKIRTDDLMSTHTCPLANTVRKRLKGSEVKRGITAVFSLELPDRRSVMHTDGTNFKKSAYGTISYVPAAFGLACASVVIRNLVNWVEVKAHTNSVKKST